MTTLLQPLMTLEELVLEGLHGLGLAWGLAIVALTVLVRLALVPIAVRARANKSLRAIVAGIVLQLLVVISLAALLRSDAAAGTFGDAGWLFIDDLSRPPAGAVLALFVGGYAGLQLLSLRSAARAGRRRLAIRLLAPLPLLLVAATLPAGVLLYVVASAAFGVAERLAFRALGPARTAVPAPAPAPA